MAGLGDIDDKLIDQIVDIATARGVPVAELSTDELADALGISRSTLYRRIGTRQVLNAAMRAAGVDTGERPKAPERVIEAAAALIREGGLPAMTMESVASRANVALPTIFALFGNRTGLLAQVFERHGPVPRIAHHLRDLEYGDVDGFQACIRGAYGELWDVLMAEHGLIAAMVLELLNDPDGDVRRFVEQHYLPQVFNRLLPWLARQAANGIVRDLPPLILGQQFVAPMVMHLATRPLVQSARVAPLPERDAACAIFADLYCAAVVQHGEKGKTG